MDKRNLLRWLALYAVLIGATLYVILHWKTPVQVIHVTGTPGETIDGTITADSKVTAFSSTLPFEMKVEGTDLDLSFTLGSPGKFLVEILHEGDSTPMTHADLSGRGGRITQKESLFSSSGSYTPRP